MSRSNLLGVLCAVLAIGLTAIASAQYPDGWRLGLAAILALGSASLAGSLWSARDRARGTVAVATCMVVIGIPIGRSALVPRPVRVTRFQTCMSSAKALAGNLLTYAQDHDDWLPPAGAWRTLSERPLEPRTRCPDGTTPWTSAMNSWVGGINLHRLEDPASMAMVFEANAYGPNANGGHEWMAPRHGGRAMIATGDGKARLATSKEVKWNLSTAR